MRPARRAFVVTFGLALAGAAGAQSLTEYGAAAAGGTAGGAAGKKVNEGLTSIFGKVDQQTKAAAKQEKSTPSPSSAPVPASPAAPAATAASAPAVSAPVSSKTRPVKIARTARRVKPEQSYNVPDPPSAATHSAGIATKAAERPIEPQPAMEPAPPAPPPPPPQVTAADLKAIAPGTSRADVLKLGVPAARITMFSDDGHLLEIYDYSASGFTFGVVRLSDGAVAQVELR